jgi:hypothetical protein
LLFVIATVGIWLLSVAYGIALWRDPSLLYRLSWLDRRAFGWLEERSDARDIARFVSLTLVVGTTALTAVALLAM